MRGSSDNMPSLFVVVATMVAGIAYEVAVGEMAIKVKPMPRRK